MSVRIARCPDHGLHGERDECFVCGGPVEQVEMIEAGGDAPHYREALEWIVDHSQEFTQEIHGYKGYGQALGAVHNRARHAVEPRPNDAPSPGASPPLEQEPR